MIISSDAELFLSKLLNANLNQLIDLKREAIEWPFPYFMYHSVMIAYLKNDIEELKSLVVSIEREWLTSVEIPGEVNPNKGDLENFYWFSQARLCIRQNENIDTALENLTKVIESHSLWRAELYLSEGSFTVENISMSWKRKVFIIPTPILFSRALRERRSWLFKTP